MAASPGRECRSNRSIYNTQSARPTGIRRVCAAELGQAARLYAAAEELAGLAREYRDAAEEAARAGGYVRSTRLFTVLSGEQISWPPTFGWRAAQHFRPTGFDGRLKMRPSSGVIEDDGTPIIHRWSDV